MNVLLEDRTPARRPLLAQIQWGHTPALVMLDIQETGSRVQMSMSVPLEGAIIVPLLQLVRIRSDPSLVLVMPDTGLDKTIKF